MTGTLVLGVGNILLADEGAGVHAMHYLEDTHDFPDTSFLDGGTLSHQDQLRVVHAEGRHRLVGTSRVLDPKTRFVP